MWQSVVENFFCCCVLGGGIEFNQQIIFLWCDVFKVDVVGIEMMLDGEIVWYFDILVNWVYCQCGFLLLYCQLKLEQGVEQKRIIQQLVELVQGRVFYDYYQFWFLYFFFYSIISELISLKINRVIGRSIRQDIS